MIESDFYSILRSVPAVMDQAEGRVYPVQLPDTPVFPAIDYKLIASVASPTLDTHGTERTRVEVNCWGKDYSSAVTLRHALVQALDGYSASGITIRLISKQDFFDQNGRQYRAMVEFYLFSSI